MPRASPIHTSFAAGEVSPLIEGRVDLQPFFSSCRRLRNFIASVQGPALKRPGFRFVGEVKDSTKTTVLVPFIFSNVQAYILEFGDRYMRVFRDNAAVTDTDSSISAIDITAPPTDVEITTSAAHGLSAGQRVLVTEIVGTVELNNREFTVSATGLTATAFQLQGISGAGMTAWTSGGKVKRIYEIVTPYAHTDVEALAHAQSADVLYLAHPGHAPRKLTRTGHTAWTLTEISFQWPPFLAENSDPSIELFVDDSVAGGVNSGIVGGAATKTITAASKTNPVRITTSIAHGLTTGESVFIEGVTGMIELNIRGFRAVVFDATNFDLEGENGTAYGTFVNDGNGKISIGRTCAKNYDEVLVGESHINAITNANPGVVTTAAAHGFANGDQVILYGCLGMLQVNNRTFTVANKTATTFELQGENTSGYPAYVNTRRGLVHRASTLNASGPFAPGDVGRFLRLRRAPLGVKPWTWNESISDTVTQRSNGGAVYNSNRTRDGTFPQASGSSTSATNSFPPAHQDFSEQWDDDGLAPSTHGIKWLHRHNGSGYVRIGRYITPNLIEVFLDKFSLNQRVPEVMPLELCRKAGSTALEHNATQNWSLGAWGPVQGYPRAVTFFEDRLWWAGSSGSPQSLWASVIGDYENHETRNDDESALLYTISSDQVDLIEWLSPGAVLTIGTVGGEFIAAASADDVAITPGNIRMVKHTNYGARAAAAPVRVENLALFVQRAGRKLRELVYDFNSDSFKGRDLTVLAEHLTTGKLKKLAFQQEPLRIVWAILDDGTLLGMTYERSQEVVGWHRHPVGGASPLTKSTAVIPHPSAPADQLWAIHSRSIDGAARQYIEFLEQPWQQGNLLEDALYADSLLTYSGVATTTLSGLYHLRGQTVQILRNGVVDPTAAVSSLGKLTVTSGTKFTVGLGYTAELIPHKLEAGSADGSSQGKLRRVEGAVLRLWQTGAGLRYGREAQNDLLTMRDEGDPVGAVITLYDGDTPYLTWPAGYEKDALIYLRHDQPTPCHVVAVMPQFSAQGRG